MIIIRENKKARPLAENAFVKVKLLDALANLQRANNPATKLIVKFYFDETYMSDLMKISWMNAGSVVFRSVSGKAEFQIMFNDIALAEVMESEGPWCVRFTLKNKTLILITCL